MELELTPATEGRIDTAVTVVEWGHGLAEGLSEDRLEVTLGGEDERRASLAATGARWEDERAQAMLGELVAVA